jgi:hypothetical protein
VTAGLKAGSGLASFNCCSCPATFLVVPCVTAAADVEGLADAGPDAAPLAASLAEAEPAAAALAAGLAAAEALAADPAGLAAAEVAAATLGAAEGGALGAAVPPQPAKIKPASAAGSHPARPRPITRFPDTFFSLSISRLAGLRRTQAVG